MVVGLPSIQPTFVASPTRPKEILVENDTFASREGHKKETGVDMDTETPSVLDEMEDFRPMEESFEDPKFNCYHRGPGQDLNVSLQVRKRNEGSYVKLHVGNIPKSLCKKAIQNLFGNFGKTVLVTIQEGTSPGYGIYSADTTYGFVVYETLREAKTAIDGLNGKEPFYLRIAFAKDHAAGNKSSQSKLPNPLTDDANPENEVEYPTSYWDEESTKPPSIIQGKSPSLFRAVSDAEQSEFYQQGVFSKFIPSRVVHLHNRNLELLEERYDGKKAGQHKKQIPGKLIKARPGGVIKRSKGEKIERSTDQRECVRCGKILSVNLKCGGGCGARYCVTCVGLDWPRHKPICQSVGVNGANRSLLKHHPKQIPESEELLLKLSSRYTFLKHDAAGGVIAPKPRFEFIKIWQLTKKFLNLVEISLTVDEDFFVIPPPERLSDDGVPQPPNTSKVIGELLNSRHSPDSAERLSLTATELAEEIPLNLHEMELDCSIPENVFTDVTIVHREGPGDFWVLTKNGIRRLLDSCRILDERSPRKGSVVSQVGRTFGYHHNGNWCRILLTKFSPYTGFLIDLGYSIEINPKDLLPLSAEWEEFPPLAVRIRLADDSPAEVLNKQVNDSLSVKPVEKLSNHALLVKSGNELAKCSIPAVELPRSGFCCLTAYHTPQAIYVRPLIATKLFDLVTQEVASYCWETETPMKTVPNIGEVVGARRTGEKTFSRALVTGTYGDQSQVIFLDSGCVESVSLENLRELPVLFKNIPATAVKVGLKDVQYPLFNADARIMLNMMMNQQFSLEHDGDLSRVKLFQSDEELFLINDELDKKLSPSHATTSVDNDRNNKGYYDFKDILWATWETSVNVQGVVTNVTNYNEIYFVCYSLEFDYIREVVTPQITEHCNSLQMTQYVPRNDEFILVQHEDAWYRAICSINPLIPFTAKVFFVDYGNTGVVPVEDIRPMVHEFAYISATAKQCIIKGLPPPDDKDQAEKLDSLFGNIEELEVLEVIKGDPSKCKVYVPSLEKPLGELGIVYSKPGGFKTLTNGLSKT